VSAQTEIRLPEVDLGLGRSTGESDYVAFWLAGAAAIGTSAVRPVAGLFAR
jgi:hypothetical protein